MIIALISTLKNVDFKEYVSHNCRVTRIIRTSP